MDHFSLFKDIGVPNSTFQILNINVNDNNFTFQIDPENTYDAVEEAHHLLDMCDENEDEKLTAEEIIEESELWIDSVGTEYGKTLRHMDEL